MNHYLMEEFYNNPSLRQRLFANARRERALAMKAGFAWLGLRLKQLTQRLQPRPSRWIERLG